VVPLAACAASPPPAKPVTLTAAGPARMIPVSTEASEVRIAFSPDGTRALWGTIGREGGPGSWDIYEASRTADGWSDAQPVSFDSPDKDFDPAFAPDGSAVYFFSNRPGGQGGDDLWMAPVTSSGYGAAQNLGPAINSSGDEWAPSIAPSSGALLFATNGRGGLGGHDLFLAKRSGDGWETPEPLGAPVNGARDDFDATFLGRDDAIVFSSGVVADEEHPDVKLYLSHRDARGWSAPVALPDAINCSPLLNLGPAIDPSRPGVLAWSAYCPERGVGGMDIFEIEYGH